MARFVAHVAIVPLPRFSPEGISAIQAIRALANLERACGLIPIDYDLARKEVLRREGESWTMAHQPAFPDVVKGLVEDIAAGRWLVVSIVRGRLSYFELRTSNVPLRANFRHYEGPKLRILLDGDDVSTICEAYDLDTGTVQVLCLRHGKPYVDDAREVAREVRTGRLAVELA
jgi:hypothetical protein